MELVDQGRTEAGEWTGFAGPEDSGKRTVGQGWRVNTMLEALGCGPGLASGNY